MKLSQACLTLCILVSISAAPDFASAAGASIADSSLAAPDILPGAASDSSQPAAALAPLSLVLSAEDLADFDHEEFGDWIAVMPGVYPLDHAGFASAYRGLMLGLPPSAIQLNFRGRPVEDQLLGAPEIGWIPPEALSKTVFTPLPLESPGARVDAVLRSMDPVPPSSRIAVRDGYYGLGTVDFDLVQKITPAVVLNGGGRVATYNGRLPHSEGYGLNLRSEIAFQAGQAWTGWCGIMQNKLNSQVAFSEISHNRDRYEADVALQSKSLAANLYGIQQRETYGGEGANAWDEIGLICRWDRTINSFRGKVEVRISDARWRLKGLSWSNTAFGGLSATLNWNPLGMLQAAGYAGLNLSDDFAPERHLGLRLEALISNRASIFVGTSQHQRRPSRFEAWADFEPGTHYLPYDPVLYQNPDLDIMGKRSLSNETYTTIFAGAKAQTKAVAGSLTGFWRRSDDLIAWRVENGVLRSYNARREETRGALGWIRVVPFSLLELGATGSYVPKRSGENRLFPEAMGHAWAQYRHKFFKDQLELRWRVWEDYWGKRQAPVPDGWETLGDAFVFSARISAYLLGAHLFWGVNNILHRDYELFPGYLMMHKEEVWGISWNFRN